MTKKLSKAQQAMVDRLKVAPNHFELCPSGSRAAGLAASAWWRTADSLRKLGLAKRCGDGVELLKV